MPQTGSNPGAVGTVKTIQAAEAAFDRLIPDSVPGGPIGVAVSGGGDSMALLTLIHSWARERSIAVVAATVDHGLRGESRAEAEAVGAHCDMIGVPHTVLTANLEARIGNLPAAARDARYALLADWSRAQGCGSILLGHTEDDVAETLLMRLARGSGIEGLAAMRESWDDLVDQSRRFRWLRPLLGLRRADLRMVLEARGVSWSEDPTNEDPTYVRVKARQALEALAPLGLDVETLATSARHMRRQRQVLEHAMVSLSVTARKWGGFGEAWLDPASLAAATDDTALRLLADTVQRVSGARYRPRFAPLEAALEAILQGNAGLTLSGCVIRSSKKRAGDAVLISREPAGVAGRVALMDGAVFWDQRWHIGAPDASAGTMVGALGEAGLQALRDARDWVATTDWAAAPQVVRLTTPALWSGEGRLISAPLACYLPELAHIRAICAEK